MSNPDLYISKFENAVAANRDIISLSPAVIDAVLKDVAASAIAHIDFLLAENRKDLDRMDISNPNYDRLKLTPERIKDIAAETIKVAEFKSPVGNIIAESTRSDGLSITKVSVPLGVVGVIYEARPNVTFDVFALCFRSKNVCILKGSSDADFSNRAIITVIHQVLKKHNVDVNVVTLLSAERESATALLNAVGYVDVLIPRGSKNLIDFVRQNSKVPVIETGAGIVHTYFDADADLEKGTAIIHNAKTRRVSVCNALDCLIINAERLADLPEITKPLAQAGVQLFVDEQSYNAINSHYPASLLHEAKPEHFGTEYLSLKMAIKTVNNLSEALAHIAKYSSKHSEAIISQNDQNIEDFLNKVDAAAVYVNASTAFTDGAQFGLGAEIGISTQKLHARGPMGINELTTYKWIVKGDGHTRHP